MTEPHHVPGTYRPEDPGVDECDAGEHWHVATARHKSRRIRHYPLWDEPCEHVTPECRFTDADEMAMWMFDWLSTTRAPLVLLSMDMEGMEPGAPEPVLFDSDDSKYHTLFIDALNTLAATTRYVHFDAIYNPIYNRPNLSLRLTAVPSDEARCGMFSCANPPSTTPTPTRGRVDHPECVERNGPGCGL